MFLLCRMIIASSRSRGKKSSSIRLRPLLMLKLLKHFSHLLSISSPLDRRIGSSLSFVLTFHGWHLWWGVLWTWKSPKRPENSWVSRVRRRCHGGALIINVERAQSLKRPQKKAASNNRDEEYYKWTCWAETETGYENIFKNLKQTHTHNLEWHRWFIYFY